ncbi:MAG: hypothetical protein K5739_12205, partial [Lachnospiraceae bacterium]|nr:hypothetical protein [Lachnospiraceae bacterium]
LDDPNRLIRGVLLNNITKGFYEKLKPVLLQELYGIREDLHLCGCFPKTENIRVGSRHLGLMLPGEVTDVKEKIRESRELLESSCDMTQILSVMESAAAPEESAAKENRNAASDFAVVETLSQTQNGPVLAVARDDAFCFYYRENLALFEQNGITIQYFSPITDPCIPTQADGLLLGGGYPEQHLQALQDNVSMRKSIKEQIEKGMPALAECGGFMYLHHTVFDKEGNPFEMAGVIEGSCHFAGRPVRFGYLQIAGTNDHKAEVSKQENSAGSGMTDSAMRLVSAMTGLKGHEFHYFDSTCNGDALLAEKPDQSRQWPCMVTHNSGIFGFPHLYYPSNPGFVTAFAHEMRLFHRGKGEK